MTLFVKTMLFLKSCAFHYHLQVSRTEHQPSKERWVRELRQTSLRKAAACTDKMIFFFFLANCVFKDAHTCLYLTRLMNLCKRAKKVWNI